MLRNRILALSVLSLAMTGLLSGCANDANSKEDEKKEEVAIPVEVAPVTTGSITATLTSTTTLEAEEQAMVVAKASGIAQRLFVEEGQWVKAGDPLLQLDTEKLQLELARADSNLSRLHSDLERTKQLFEKKLVSSDNYDKVRFEFESQKAAYDLTRLELNYATIRAPISGVVSKRLVKIGNMVQLHQAVFEITDFDPLHAVIHIPERDLAKLHNKQQAYIEIDALKGNLFNASILRIAPTVDAGSGTFKVTLVVNDKQRQLKPGMFGRVAVTYAEHNNALLLKKDAVLSEDGETAVFVVREGKAYRTAVETGFSDKANIEIVKGVSVNDQVVITGQNSLKNEAKVEILKL